MQGRQLLYVKEFYLVTSLLSNKACSFFNFIFIYLYIMKSLYFAGGFLVLTGWLVGWCWCWWLLLYFVGLYLLLYGLGVLWAGSVLVLSISVGSLLCWDGDVGSSRLVLWAGRLKVTLLSGLNISCKCLLLRLKSYPSLCILTM